jgi:hypothetical protein
VPTDLLESEETDAAARPTGETVSPTPVGTDVLRPVEERVDTGTARTPEEGGATSGARSPAPTGRKTTPRPDRKKTRRQRGQYDPLKDEYSPEYAHQVFLEQARQTDPDVNPADYPTTSLDRALKLARRASSAATSFSIVANTV